MKMVHFSSADLTNCLFSLTLQGNKFFLNPASSAVFNGSASLVFANLTFSSVSGIVPKAFLASFTLSFSSMQNVSQAAFKINIK